MITEDKRQAATNPSDAALLARYATTGDGTALDELIIRHRSFAYRLALRWTGNEADAEDMVQQAFLNVMRFAGRFDGERNARYWIGGIVLNQCREHRRVHARRNRREIEAGRNQLWVVSASDADPKDAVKTAVRELATTLPKRLRIFLSLHYYEGMSVRELSKMFNLKERTIHNALSKGVQLLRGRLATKGYRLEAAALIGLLNAVGAAEARIVVPAHLAAALRQLPQMPVAAVQSIHATAGVAWGGKLLLGAAMVIVAAIIGAVSLSSLSEDQSVAAAPAAEAVAAADEKQSLKDSYRWLFTEGPCSELQVIKGKWEWQTGDANSSGGMKVSDDEVAVLLPMTIPKRPFVVSLSMSTNSNKAFCGGHWLVPAIDSGGYYSCEHENWAVQGLTQLEKPQMKITYYFFDQWWVICFDSQPRVVSKYLKPYPSDRISFGFRDVKISEITLHFLRENEIPENVRNVVNLISTSKTPSRIIPAYRITD